MLIRKAVVFNPDDPDQQRMLQHIAKRTNFSAYIKRLVQRDMDLEGATVRVEKSIPELPIDLNGFI